MMNTTRYGLGLVLAVAMVACGGGNNAQRRMKIANQEVDRMTVPSRSLSDFRKIELRESSLEPAVAEDDAKVAKVQDLDKRVQARLAPVISAWPSSGQAGTLIIQPHVVSLRIVSGGSRFWLGAFAGSSHIDVDLRLIDGESNQDVARVKVRQDSDAMAGAWSYGSTDQNLLNYVTDIIYTYVQRHGQSGTGAAPASPQT